MDADGYARPATLADLKALLSSLSDNKVEYHPLASREVVDAAMMDELARQLLNPEVIKRTYPDGKLPEGAVIPPDCSLLIA